MIVLGISLIAGIGVNIYNLFSGEYFSLSAYAAWQSYGTLFLLTALAELTVMTICLLASVAVFYWFIKRRDIFPWMFTAYIVTLILSQFLLITLYGNFSEFPELKNSADHGWKQIIRSMIYGAIWCTYVFRSERAKGTFLKRAQSKFF